MKSLSPTRFLIWLIFFVPGAAALMALSRGWSQVGFGLIITGNLALHKWKGGKDTGRNLTTREMFLVGLTLVGVPLLIIGLVYLVVTVPITFPSLPEPSPFVQRLLIAAICFAALIYNARRLRAWSEARSA